MTDAVPDTAPDTIQAALDLLVEASGLTPEQVRAALTPEALIPDLALEALARAAGALTLRPPRPGAAPEKAPAPVEPPAADPDVA